MLLEYHSFHSRISELGLDTRPSVMCIYSVDFYCFAIRRQNANWHRKQDEIYFIVFLLHMDRFCRQEEINFASAVWVRGNGILNTIRNFIVNFPPDYSIYTNFSNQQWMPTLRSESRISTWAWQYHRYSFQIIIKSL